MSDSIPALAVHQWLKEWDEIQFNEELHQREPQRAFYVFPMRASLLRKLSGIYRRNAGPGHPRENDMGVQRQHDENRSKEISRYIRGGYPWSTLSEVKRNSRKNDSLKKPGWLPTAIVVNFLVDGDSRQGQKVDKADLIQVQQGNDDSCVVIRYPETVQGAVAPIEVIDGQHRLFAFDDDADDGKDYELPVVAFQGLDIAWQAYLFWTINIKPKKINASLAFDLYPLLREQSWLENGETLPVYRESRAQDLVSCLWSYPSSPWHNRINMLGGLRKENGPVTQAAFVRSLTSSMIKKWPSGRNRIGGLFGGSENGDGLSWSRVQQAAFLIEIWNLMETAVKKTNKEWAESLRHQGEDFNSDKRDLAFSGEKTLLATDQGVRAFQSTINDICRINYKSLKLDKWEIKNDDNEISDDNIRSAIDSLFSQPVHEILLKLCEQLANYDWRSSLAEDLDEQAKMKKQTFRGSGGYSLLRTDLLKCLGESADKEIRELVQEVTDNSEVK